jgi:hypothetical protein
MFKRIRASTDYVGRRGACLIFLAIIFLAIGQGYLLHPDSLSRVSLDNLHYALVIAPVPLWGALWIICGCVDMLAAFWKKFEPIAFGASALFSLVWGLSYLASTIGGYGERAYVGAVTYCAVAAFIQILSGWPEAKRDLP